MTEASMIGLLVATVAFGALLYLAAPGELISAIGRASCRERG